MIIRELITQYTIKANNAKVDSFNKSIDRSKSTMKSAAGAAGGLRKKLQGLQGTMAGVVSAAAGLRVLKMLTTDITENADAIYKFANGLKWNTDQLQAYIHVASLAGLEQKDFLNGVRKTTQFMGQASTVGGVYLKFLGNMGYTLKDFAGLQPHEIFKKLLFGLNKIKDEKTRAATANAMMGKSWVIFSGLASEGIKKFDAASKDAFDRHLIINKKTLKASAKFNDGLNIVKKTFKAITVVLAGPVIDAFNKLFDKFLAWSKASGNFEAITKGATKAMKFLAIALGVATAGIIAFKLAAYAANPELLAIVAAIAAITYVGYEMYNLFAGKGSIFEGIVPLDIVEDIKAAFFEMVKIAKPIVLFVANELKKNLMSAVGLFMTLWKAIKVLWPVLKITLIGALLPMIVAFKVISVVVRYLVNSLSFLIDTLSILWEVAINIGKALWEALSGDKFIKDMKGIVKWVGKVFNDLGEIFNTVKYAFQGFFMWLTDWIEIIAFKVGGFLASIFSTDAISATWEKFKSFLNDKIKWIIGLLPDWLSKRLGFKVSSEEAGTNTTSIEEQKKLNPAKKEHKPDKKTEEKIKKGNKLLDDLYRGVITPRPTSSSSAVNNVENKQTVNVNVKVDGSMSMEGPEVAEKIKNAVVEQLEEKDTADWFSRVGLTEYS